MTDQLLYIGNANLKHAWTSRSFDDRAAAILWARDLAAKGWDVRIGITGEVDWDDAPDCQLRIGDAA